MTPKVYIFLATGFEEIETITPIDVLRRAGFSVSVVSTTGSLTVSGAHQVSIVADVLLETINCVDADLLLLPGGMPGTVNLQENKLLLSQIEIFAKTAKPIAAICAAPRILGQLGLLIGHSATCYPGNESLLSGANVSTDAVVESGQFITARGAGSAMQFSLAIVALFFGKNEATSLAKKMMVE